MKACRRALPTVPLDANVVSMLAGAIALVVFIIDALTPLDIAIAVFYVVVVLLVASTGNRSSTVAAAWGCVVLTLLGFVMSHDEAYSSGAAARCAVSLLAIATTSMLALRNQAATTTLREQLELLNLAHDAIVVHDMNDRITFWNHGAQALYGWTAQQALGQSLQDMTQTVFPVPYDEVRAELLRTNRWHGELTRVRQDGSAVVISSRAALWRDEKGNPRAVLATNNDITGRKQAEQALERSEAFLRDAQRLSSTGSIAVRFPDGEMWWSDEAYRIFDYPRDTVPSIDAVLARTHPDDLALVRGVFGQAAGGETLVDIEHRLSMPDGSVKYVHYVARLATRQSGHREYVGALMDITGTRRAQEALARSNDELAHATRITMLGELAASIAHEVTQPIAAIVTSGGAALRWLNRPTPEISETAQSIAQMIRDAKRADEVIQRIRAMARKRDRLPAPVDLNGMVGESIELVRRELERHRIDLRVELAEPSLTAYCDRVQLQQVLINLIMNAVQAMAEVAGPRTLLIAARRLDGEEAQVIVQDSGTGISDEHAGRLFNTFFTTRDDGMGMGLSICRSIVEAHGGRIWAESPPTGGAVLKFVLPVDEGRSHEQ
ncbi:PAS domain-containing sensor histidine kinase [Paraburkholderia aromaticivorans]|uniref:histidine kinase n=1 Tax=Paraburkholderia aromaticivorans TaxID=2026199 RepID=A0A248VVX5_9BURK|nr:PAS domain S-box protein [Paraburkholderia aromaticivorans]ASW03035.1 PAS domain-containing sensor histidine kinase [Paraburkholderia aromaticivorans]